MDLKKLVEEIEIMNKDHHLEIFKIINSYDIHYTENNNGVFINMSLLSNECLNKIKDYVKYINENSKEILKFEKVKEENKLKLKQNN